MSQKHICLSVCISDNNSLYESAEHLSAMNIQLSSITEEKDLLNTNLSSMSNKLFSMTEERDLLHANLTKITEELKRLKSLFNQSESLCLYKRSYCGNWFNRNFKKQTLIFRGTYLYEPLASLLHLCLSL